MEWKAGVYPRGRTATPENDVLTGCTRLIIRNNPRRHVTPLPPPPSDISTTEGHKLDDPRSPLGAPDGSFVTRAVTPRSGPRAIHLP